MLDKEREFEERLADEMPKKGAVGLDPYFYTSEHVYAKELETILFKSWIYAAHVSQIPHAGDYVLLNVGDASIIITRLQSGDIRAHANSCRHRGARLCREPSGNASAFVCPYHAWTYNLDGSLRMARHMDGCDGFEKSEFGLRPIQVSEYMGLIFVNADLKAPDYVPALSNVSDQLGAYDLATAKIARQQTYVIDANWKFCLENYLECYHCAPAHKAYARMHTLQDTYENVAPLVEGMQARAPRITGVPGIADDYERIYGAADSFGACVAHGRYGLYDGYQTGSKDGAPVAPLMGAFKDFDGGAGDFQFGPVSFMLNYPDHCVLYRFLPRSLTQTDVELVWFVNGNAAEGVDYDPSKVTWLWDHTTEEDTFIIMENSRGALSHFYEPGPLQPEFEETLRQFLTWYVDALSGQTTARQQPEKVTSL